MILPTSWIGTVGFLIGTGIGAAVWRARLCSFGAVEDALLGRDWRRMKVFGLALGIGLLLTQLLALSGHFEARLSTYIPDRLALIPIGVGALMFGGGMAMVGTCAFGSLVRLGGGDLRSLIVLLVFGAMAYAMQRGILAPLRLATSETFAIAMPGGNASSFGALSAHFTGINLSFPAAVAVSFGLILAYLIDPRLRRARRMALAGVLLGLGVVGGWLATQVLIDGFEAGVRTQSLTFVAPVGRTFFGFLLNAIDLSDFGVGTVIGTVSGAFAMAYHQGEFRWNAFDDHVEMRRHLGGAVLMGVGGVLAGGCTIGQGLTAGSLMAVTWPLTIAGMALGARLGIAYLLGEGWREIFSGDSSR